MSFYVGPAFANANHFGGLAAECIRSETKGAVEDEDARREFWLKHMLPKITEPFLDSVVTSPKKFIKFSLESLDGPNAPEKHMVFFQTFAYVASSLKNVPIRNMPWQFRFIIHKDSRAVLDTAEATDRALRADVFERAGWYFWVTSTGFCIAPKALCDELSDISAMYASWIKVRDVFDIPESSEVAVALAPYPDMPALEEEA